MRSHPKGLVISALVVIFLFARGLEAAEVRQEEKFLWSSYMICFGLNRDFHGFKDRPLDRPPSDGTNPRLVDLQNAVNAGIDAFSVDLFIMDKNAFHAFGTLVSLVNEHNVPIQLSPMFDGLDKPDAAIDEVAAKIHTWFERFGSEPCVVRYGGKPVIFTYAAYRLTPEQWRTVFGRLNDAGYEGCWIAEMARYLNMGPSLEFNPGRPWLDLFTGGNIFSARRPERTREVVESYRSVYSPTLHRWVGSTAIGYWRPEIAVYASQDGTRQFRDTWRAVVDNGIKWVQQATWNDFSENHHIMPSENYSTTFVELNQYLTAQWKKQPAKLDASRLYLSQQQEIQVGEEALFELLVLLRPGDVPARVGLWVTDGEGEVVKTFAPEEVGKAGLHAAAFKMPVAEAPSGRLLFPEGRLLDSEGTTVLAVRGPYSVVYPGGYRPERNYSWLHTPAHRQISGVNCELLLDGHADGAVEQSEAKGVVSLRVNCPVELVDVEVLHDGAQMVSLRRDAPEVALSLPITWQGKLALNRRGLLNWGAYAVRAVTADGRIATSRPVFVERPAEADATLGLWTFDADTDADVLDSSPWLHDGRLGGRRRQQNWRPEPVTDPWGGRCLEFDGKDDRVLLEGAIVPPNLYTVECWIRPRHSPEASSPNQLIFVSAGGAVVLDLRPGGVLRLARKCSDRWHEVKDSHPVAFNEWQHVAGTYDGITLRLYRNGVLVGQETAPGEGRCGQVSIGFNSVTQSCFYAGDIDEVRLSAKALGPQEFGPHNPLGTDKEKR